jgi:hypothetical protein
VAALRHRVARVDREVHEHLLQVSGVGADGPERLGQVGSDLDLLADDAPEHSLQPTHDAVEVDLHRGEHLLAAERE